MLPEKLVPVWVFPKRNKVGENMLDKEMTFSCNDLILQGVLHMPRISGVKLPGVVLCHPHPLYGGNMDNNVIMAVARNLNEQGIAALRFNFRGVGASNGRYDDGNGEQDDARSALAALASQPEIDSSRLAIMGYSFGGMIALAVGGKDEHVQVLAAVSPVIVPGVLQGVNKPVYLTCGSNDHVVMPEALYGEVEKMSLPGKVEVVQGVDHFWWGHEGEMARKVGAFFADGL